MERLFNDVPVWYYWRISIVPVQCAYYELYEQQVVSG